jgi:hypothetical protein
MRGSSGAMRQVLTSASSATYALKPLAFMMSAALQACVTKRRLNAAHCAQPWRSEE